MFLPEADIERGVLRQGDIISKVHLLGAINLNAIQYLTLPSEKERFTSWQICSPPNYGDAMVISHSCELSPENTAKLTSIILAPVRDIHKATKPEQIRELIISNLIDRANPTSSFLKYFYLVPHEALEFADGAVVDFSKCFSVRKQCYANLLQKKVAQLTPEINISMTFKIALYFHRGEASAAPADVVTAVPA